MKILLAALTSSFMLVGCTPRIEVAAPKEPITINMNVKIEHEIIIKADKDVEELLETRSDQNITSLCISCWLGKQQCNGIDSG